MIIRIIKKIILYVIFIFGIEIKKTGKISNIKFCYNFLNPGGRCYFTEKSWVEKNNILYQLIKQEFNPDLVLDIGANYGFTSVMFANIFNAKIIAIEPIKKLCEYIDINRKINNANILLIRAICGDNSLIDYKYISKNPFYSQDNRVNRPSMFWKKEKVDLISIDKNLFLFKNKFTFIKIDVQGYEYEVIHGGINYLMNFDNWLIKMEFSPYLLRYQGTNPSIFLEYLIKKYDIIDIYSGMSFNMHRLEELFKNKKINTFQVNRFIEYVENLNHKKLGQVELLIKSKKL